MNFEFTNTKKWIQKKTRVQWIRHALTESTTSMLVFFFPSIYSWNPLGFWVWFVFCFVFVINDIHHIAMSTVFWSYGLRSPIWWNCRHLNDIYLENKSVNIFDQHVNSNYKMHHFCERHCYYSPNQRQFDGSRIFCAVDWQFISYFFVFLFRSFSFSCVSVLILLLFTPNKWLHWKQNRNIYSEQTVSQTHLATFHGVKCKLIHFHHININYCQHSI